jgi:PmbA protein
VLFDAPLSSGLLGSFVQAVSGNSLYKKLSFLNQSIGESIFSPHIQVHENPFLRGAIGSAPFDDEGVKVNKRNIVENGTVLEYFLSSYSAKRLKMKTTGNAGGSHNLRMYSSATLPTDNLDQMLEKLDTGFFVTELMGQGVNGVTGDYSKGASGFWVEKGKIVYPVSEVTIAGNLKTMYKNITAIGADECIRGNKTCGSILISKMTVAGT